MASLTLRKAVKAALEHFADHADLLGAITSQDVTFEEAELSEDEAYWHITLGYPVKKRIQGFVEPLVSGYERKYTIFVIDGETGTLQSLKMRPDVEPTPL